MSVIKTSEDCMVIWFDFLDSSLQQFNDVLKQENDRKHVMVSPLLSSTQLNTIIKNEGYKYIKDLKVCLNIADHNSLYSMFTTILHSEECSRTTNR